MQIQNTKVNFKNNSFGETIIEKKGFRSNKKSSLNSVKENVFLSFGKFVLIKWISVSPSVFSLAVWMCALCLSFIPFLLYVVNAQSLSKSCSQTASSNRHRWFPTQKNLIFKERLSFDFHHIQNILNLKSQLCINKKDTFEIISINRNMKWKVN